MSTSRITTTWEASPSKLHCTTQAGSSLHTKRWVSFTFFLSEVCYFISWTVLHVIVTIPEAGGDFQVSGRSNHLADHLISPVAPCSCFHGDQYWSVLSSIQRRSSHFLHTLFLQITALTQYVSLLFNQESFLAFNAVPVYSFREKGEKKETSYKNWQQHYINELSLQEYMIMIC